MFKKLNKVWSELYDPSSKFNELQISAIEAIAPASTARLWSKKASHIDVAGDPPLCSRCRTMVLEPRVLSKEYMHSLRLIRLKTAAELGCTLCYMFYNVQWTPSNFKQSVTERVQQISNRPRWIRGESGAQPDEILYQFDDDEEGPEEDKQPTLSLFMTSKANLNGDRWQKKFLLLPKKDVEDFMPTQLATMTEVGTATSMAISWMADCEESHTGCDHSMKIPSWRPTRLVKISNQNSSIRLCLPSEVQPAPYLTLSHCWGGLEFFKLLSSSIDDMLVQIPLEKLSKVFQDTIEVTRLLGFQYVWIDSLCIIQDSRQDWERESVVMGKVYKNSWCTISATGFQNGESGFFAQRDASLLLPRNFRFNVQDEEENKISKGQYYVVEDYLRADVFDAPLNQRGWVFQERVLSPRVLHFGSRQIFWECKELTACETFPEGLPYVLDPGFKARMFIPEPKESTALSEDEKADVLILWGGLVSGYNSGRLTNWGDKFVAIAGLAKEIQKLLPVPFVAGIWKYRMLEQLLWSTDNPPEQRTRAQRSEEYQAPSWSWAAINGPVLGYQNMKVSPLATIEETQVDYATESHFGQLTGGYIRIRGVLSRATISFDVSIDSTAKLEDAVTMELRSARGKDLTIEPIVAPDVYVPPKGILQGIMEQYSIIEALGSKHIWILPLVKCEKSTTGLALTRTSKKGQYRRLGIFILRHRKRVDLGSHVPWLDLDDYEVRYNEQEVTLTII